MNKLLTILSTFGLLLLNGSLSTAQTTTLPEPKKELIVQRATAMEQFEPEMVQSAEERLQLKKERLVFRKKQRNIIDTLQISDRKKKKLLELLNKNPHADLLVKTVNSHIEDEKE